MNKEQVEREIAEMQAWAENEELKYDAQHQQLKDNLLADLFQFAEGLLATEVKYASRVMDEQRERLVQELRAPGAGLEEALGVEARWGKLMAIAERLEPLKQ